jgi:hypothetical protein
MLNKIVEPVISKSSEKILHAYHPNEQDSESSRINSKKIQKDVQRDKSINDNDKISDRKPSKPK